MQTPLSNRTVPVNVSPIQKRLLRAIIFSSEDHSIAANLFNAPPMEADWNPEEVFPALPVQDPIAFPAYQPGKLQLPC